MNLSHKCLLAALMTIPSPGHAGGKFLDLLKSASVQKVTVDEGRVVLKDVKLDGISDDYFCIRHALQDTGAETRRCYPASAIRWIDGDATRTVIAIAQ